MTSEPFARRVQTLRDAWIERREMQAFASSHDFDSQYQLLLTLHRWAVEGIRDVEEIYGEAVEVDLSPAPDRTGPAPAFSVAVAGTYSVNFALLERTHGGSSHWAVVASVISNAPRGLVVPAGPERRNGQWTRTRLEELLLSVLGAYERARTDRDLQVAGPPSGFCSLRRCDRHGLAGTNFSSLGRVAASDDSRQPNRWFG